MDGNKRNLNKKWNIIAILFLVDQMLIPMLHFKGIPFKLSYLFFVYFVLDALKNPLDIKGSKKLVGKPVKKDNKKGKSTLPNLMGHKKAYMYAYKLKKKLLLKLKKHGKKANNLTDTIEFILGRNF